ncbi:bactofilin family protein [Thiomicrorhabdus heinhorstiae]|uniref:bactofilin family protein n=1 Tax=Thiomicrorhabdus heinhorstiae TaxID=2748010 RepID=UPI002B4AD22B|nr:polymer-forming cytoskeletal protein [Thiomicrorhabdus heinhorstiae]
MLAKKCTIKGELVHQDGPLHVDGTVEGVLDSDHDVSIGHEGRVSGLVKARNLVVSGVLEGKVACEKLEILKGGKFVGELVCGDLAIESGGKFIGHNHEVTEDGVVLGLPETFQKLIHGQLADDGLQKTLRSIENVQHEI